jgi:hypothetical protein
MSEFPSALLPCAAGRPLVVDHGTAIYVLGAGRALNSDSGADASATAAAAHAFVESIAAGRLPLPDVRFIDMVSAVCEVTGQNALQTAHCQLQGLHSECAG